MDHSNAQFPRCAVYARSATDVACESSITAQVDSCIAAAASMSALPLPDECDYADSQKSSLIDERCRLEAEIRNLAEVIGEHGVNGVNHALLEAWRKKHARLDAVADMLDAYVYRKTSPISRRHPRVQCPEEEIGSFRWRPRSFSLSIIWELPFRSVVTNRDVLRGYTIQGRAHQSSQPHGVHNGS